MSIKLKKPLEYGGQTLAALAVRVPKVAEIQKFGIPFYFDDKGRVKFEMESVFKYACAMNQVPPPILEKHLDETGDAGKLVRFEMQLLNFFDLSGE